MFDKYAGAGRSLQVKTKGWYWAGRASSQSGDPLRAPQLFRARRGYSRAVLRPAGARAARPDRPRARRDAVAAGDRCPAPGIQPEAAGPRGQAARPAGPLRASRACSSGPCRKTSTPTPSGCLRSSLATQIWRPGPGGVDGPVGPQRRQRLLLQGRLPDPFGQRARPAVCWSLVHGITRQESSFDRARSATPAPAG